MTDDEIFAAGREYGRRSRIEQGLPPRVTDPVVIDKLRRILLAPTGARPQGVREKSARAVDEREVMGT